MVLLRLAERVWFYTDEEVLLYQRSSFGGSPRVASISNGLALDEARALRRPYRPEERPARIFFIGRLTPKARLDLLLHALATPALADSLGLGDRVEWHGATIDEAGIAAVANACRLFVYPGGVGLSLVHAMAYGLPAVLHDDRWTHMPEISAFQAGQTGRTFRTGDPDSLAQSIAGLIDDHEALRAASARAIATADERFTTGEMTRRTLRLLQELGVACGERPDEPDPLGGTARLA
jgi:glycosyltransferase involved in cell wall biosynthesis